ncbi:MAG: NADH-quinone oxidoreductase subunit NuoN [Pseudomonadota bacterium]
MSALEMDLLAVGPEITLAVGGMILLLLGVFRAPGAAEGPEVAPRNAAAGLLVSWATVALLLVTAVWVAGLEGQRIAFNGLFVDDTFARFAKVLILAGSAIVLALGLDAMRQGGILKFEYPILILFAALGMCVMVSARDLMTLYMGLELQSLSLYIIASFQRDSLRSTEAGLKYFVLGALSSGLLLFGASLIYGFAGSTRFDQIAAALADGGDPPVGLLFGLAFLIAGFAFKISAAPFHMWTPDVYEGAPTPVTAFFATAPKVAAAALFARAMMTPFAEITDAWSQILAFLAICSMFLGAFAGIGQTELKRLLAYSSIGHMGFALVALSVGGEAGVQAMLVYLAIYLVMSIGVFAFVLAMSRDGEPTTRIADLDGLSQTHPGWAIGLTLLMFSLAGVPPLWGFFAKYAAFSAAVQGGLVWLATAGVVASVISAYYYLNIVRRMYFNDPERPIELNAAFPHRLCFGAAAAAMILAIAPAPLLNGFGTEDAAARAAASLEIGGERAPFAAAPREAILAEDEAAEDDAALLEAPAVLAQ